MKAPRILAAYASDPSTHIPDDCVSIAETEQYDGTEHFLLYAVSEPPEPRDEHAVQDFLAEQNEYFPEHFEHHAEKNVYAEQCAHPMRNELIAHPEQVEQHEQLEFLEHSALHVNTLDDAGYRLSGRLPAFACQYRKHAIDVVNDDETEQRITPAYDLAHGVAIAETSALPDISGHVNVTFFVKNVAIENLFDELCILDLRPEATVQDVAEAFDCSSEYEHENDKYTVLRSIRPPGVLVEAPADRRRCLEELRFEFETENLFFLIERSLKFTSIDGALPVAA